MFYSYPVYAILHDFATYLLVMFFFLGTAIGLHELGHVFFARYHHLEYRILFKNGNLTVSADWGKLGNKKVYGHILGIVFGLPAIIAGGWIYATPIFLLLYLLSCYDDFNAVATGISNYKKIFCAGF